MLTIEGLLAGNERPRYPDLSRGESTFKKARREYEDREQGNLFSQAADKEREP